MSSSFITFTKGLSTLKAVLKKAEAHATSNNIPIDDLFNARLIDDMLPLSFQVFVVNNTAIKAISRGTFVEPPVQAQNDKTFDDFYARIDETLAEIEKVDLASLAATKDKTFKAPLGRREVELTFESYAAAFSLPTFFFHLVTVYNILRARGVPLGKLDYLGGFLADSTPRV
ncbi:hypothetical protein BDV12DRAFT_177017 [Aspergillus spectabilis]